MVTSLPTRPGVPSSLTVSDANNVLFLSQLSIVHCVIKREKYRVATNLENLEYSGISLNVENSGNSQGILCNLREKL